MRKPVFILVVLVRAFEGSDTHNSNLQGSCTTSTGSSCAAATGCAKPKKHLRWGLYCFSEQGHVPIPAPFPLYVARHLCQKDRIRSFLFSLPRGAFCRSYFYRTTHRLQLRLGGPLPTRPGLPLLGPLWAAHSHSASVGRRKPFLLISISGTFLSCASCTV